MITPDLVYGLMTALAILTSIWLIGLLCGSEDSRKKDAMHFTEDKK